LSAAMHIAVVQANLDSFIHAHGDAPGMEDHSAHAGHGMASMGHIHGTVQKQYGPFIESTVVFPTKGLYQIFGEFKHHGQVVLTRFMVEVE
ncbi:MAG TPA: hypothetical protein VK445_00410, partial [Dissulfurispiraceae bacterium]|nr:hypothetical protein [Dissulfurispiraceae bacterium]